MEKYYRERAQAYDELYKTSEWQDDLPRLKAWVAAHTAGRNVLEVAAGTGFWTAAAGPAAKAITATDRNPEMLALAAKRRLGPHVTLLAADAHALPAFGSPFGVGMAHLWWSHVEKQRERQFLLHFSSRLRPGATLLMIDQIYVKGYSLPAFRRDRLGNRYELRTLENGRVFQIVKNYPTVDELRQSVGSACDDVRIIRLPYFWALRARIRAR
jgi:demethylmenaquinone methyltransferase/2-methoxy-6-polyprenyl-1,4-benzoquinol methylase